MSVYIFDTDHLSLYGRNHPPLLERLKVRQAALITTVINVEEQLRGRLAQISEAKDPAKQELAYHWMIETMLLLSEFKILPYSEKSQVIFQGFKAQKIRVGTQDLRIASIVLANEGILLTRNLQDFERIPGLLVQNWSD